MISGFRKDTDSESFKQLTMLRTINDTDKSLDLFFDSQEHGHEIGGIIIRGRNHGIRLLGARFFHDPLLSNVSLEHHGIEPIGRFLGRLFVRLDDNNVVSIFEKEADQARSQRTSAYDDYVHDKKSITGPDADPDSRPLPLLSAAPRLCVKIPFFSVPALSLNPEADGELSAVAKALVDKWRRRKPSSFSILSSVPDE